MGRAHEGEGMDPCWVGLGGRGHVEGQNEGPSTPYHLTWETAKVEENMSDVRRK